jgi:hypothetical protein
MDIALTELSQEQANLLRQLGTSAKEKDVLSVPDDFLQTLLDYSLE